MREIDKSNQQFLRIFNDEHKTQYFGEAEGARVDSSESGAGRKFAAVARGLVALVVYSFYTKNLVSRRSFFLFLPDK